MKKTIGIVIGIGLLLLLGCAAPTPTPSPTPSSIPATATPTPAPSRTPAPLPPPPRVLVIPREGSRVTEVNLTNELGVMISMLEQAGFQVVVASASGQPFVGRTTTVETDLELADVKVADYIGFILPCMAQGIPGPVPPEAVEIVREAVAEGKPVAAQQGSVLILHEAGVLEGKKYAFEYHKFSEGIYSGTGVVQDGNIITSATCSYRAKVTGRRDGTPELTQKLIDLLAHLL